MLKYNAGNASNYCHICFSKNVELVYCNDVEGVLQDLKCTHRSEGRRCFVDLPKFISKTVLLYSGSIHSSILIGHSVHVKETDENMDLLLKVPQNMTGIYVQIVKP